MPPRRRVFHPQETYRFSMTRTLSDYPLLIGEILRRDDIRAVRRAKRRLFLFDLGRILGMRVPLAVGIRNNRVLAEPSWQLNSRNQDQLRISLSSNQSRNGTIH